MAGIIGCPIIDEKFVRLCSENAKSEEVKSEVGEISIGPTGTA
jgi:hypothetical protein